jgi:hypothetical protein
VAADEPVLVDVSETGVVVAAEIAPGMFSYITRVTDDGRVLASNTPRNAAMNTAQARALLANKAVRAAFPTARIVGASE